jgi:hypothetical protein
LTTRTAAGRVRRVREVPDRPDWHDLLWFHEYFHGDTGAGIGASHQTGLDGIVAHLVCQNGSSTPSTGGRSTARMGMQPSPVKAKATKD